jgi:hypothetical protein
MRQIKWGVFLVALILVVGGCARAPQQQVGEAEQALRTAESQGAEQYAPEELARAREAMEQLRAELQEQEGRFSLLRNYNRAQSLAREVVNAAQEATTRAAAATARLRSEVSGMIDEARASLRTAREGVGRVAGALRASLQSRLDAAESRIAQAEAGLDQGGFDEARRNAAAAREEIRGVLRELERIAAPSPASRKR